MRGKERLNEIPAETMQAMAAEAFSVYYAEATRPCGNWHKGMKFPELEKAEKCLSEFNDELERRMAKELLG